MLAKEGDLVHSFLTLGLRSGLLRYLQRRSSAQMLQAPLGEKKTKSKLFRERTILRILCVLFWRRYLAPEYFMYGKMNDKIDVYAYGVVLLELLSGRKPVSSESPKARESLVMWVSGDTTLKGL